MTMFIIIVLLMLILLSIERGITGEPRGAISSVAREIRALFYTFAIVAAFIAVIAHTEESMNQDQIKATRAVIGVLKSPRNRFGKIEYDRAASDALHKFCDTFGKLPHGGYDCADKAQMILSLMIGDKPVSCRD